MTGDPKYMLNEDLAPQNDALDRQVWDEIIDALSAKGRKLDKEARTLNSISFRRHCLLFERAERVARAEARNAPEWKQRRAEG